MRCWTASGSLGGRDRFRNWSVSGRCTATSGTYDEGAESPFVIQGRVVLENLDAIRQALIDVAAGRAARLDVSGRPSIAWGQPRLTKYCDWKLRGWRRRRESASPIACPPPTSLSATTSRGISQRHPRSPRGVARYTTSSRAPSTRRRSSSRSTTGARDRYAFVFSSHADGAVRLGPPHRGVEPERGDPGRRAG